MKIERLFGSTKDFAIATTTPPHIDRKDGGHLVVVSKNPLYKTLQDIPLEESSDLIVIARLIGAAMLTGLRMRKVPIELINYQINGNWSFDGSPRDPFHLHLYGRARQSVNQEFGQALALPPLASGHYDKLSGLTVDDMRSIADELKNLLRTGQYTDKTSIASKLRINELR